MEGRIFGSVIPGEEAVPLTEQVVMARYVVIPLLALLSFAFGTVFMFIPFLPFGWLLYFVTALLLSPYVKPFRRSLRWLALKDKSGLFKKVRARVAALYRWVGDERHARIVEDEGEEV